MAKLTIQMMSDPHSGDKLFRIALVSDEDATPNEHEGHHRAVVARLFPTIDLDSEKVGRVRVERERPLLEPPPSCGCDDGDGYEVIDL